jgi:hypothetical protein
MITTTATTAVSAFKQTRPCHHARDAQGASIHAHVLAYVGVQSGFIGSGFNGNLKLLLKRKRQ